MTAARNYTRKGASTLASLRELFVIPSQISADEQSALGSKTTIPRAILPASEGQF
jgi:hypothetical protein